MASKILASFLLIFALLISGCAKIAHSQTPSGGNEIFAGRYVWEGYGTLFSSSPGWQCPICPNLLPSGFPAPQQVPYIENGLIIADGNGHYTQCSTASSGMVVTGPSNSVPGLPGINCDAWTYSLTNFMGSAKSSIGDSMYLFCTDSGKKCVSVNNNPGGFAWGERMERE